MKRKFINLLLAVVFLVGSAQVLTSCKDNLEDLYDNLRDENLTLEKALKGEIEVLKGQITALDGVTKDLQKQIDGLQKQINDLDETYVSHSEFNGLVDKYIASVSAYKNLKEVLDNLKKVYDEVNDAHGTYNTIGERFAAIETALDNYKKRIEDLEGKVGTLEGNVGTLEGKVTTLEKLVGEHTTQIETLNEFMNEWKPQLDKMKTDIAKAISDAAAAQALADNNKGRIDALEEALKNIKQCNCPENIEKLIEDKINEKYTEIISEINEKLKDYATNEALNEVKEALKDYATKKDLEDYATKEELAAAKAALTEAINNVRDEAAQNLEYVRQILQEQINSLIDKVIENGLKISQLEVTVSELAEAFETYKEEVDKKFEEVAEELGLINTTLENLQEQITENKEAIETINEVLDKIVDRIVALENRITSIVFQGSENDVLGYFSTPFGIDLNMLLAYYGQNTNAVNVKFPNRVSSIEFNNPATVISDKDWAILQECGVAQESFASGEVFMNEENGNLGKVYVTLNPANIDLDGKEFTLVTSQDKDVKVKLDNFKPSDKELTFGWSRTETSPNGFYEADATISAEDIDNIRFKIDANGDIKRQAQKVLEDKTLRSILGLGNVIYNEFKSVSPRLGVKAAWVEDEYDVEGNKVGTKNQAVYSQYAVGAMSFQPLSYRFMVGQSFKQYAIPDLRNQSFTFTNGATKVNLSSVMIHVGTASIPLDLQVIIPNTNEVSFKLKGMPLKATVSASGEITYSDFNGELDVKADLSDLKPKIKTYVETTFAYLSDNAQAQIEAGFNASLASLESQINNAFATLEVQINQTIDELIASLNVQANDKYQKFVSKFYDNGMVNYLERFIERVNGILKDPNHYLQTVLLYHDGTTYAKMSNVKAMPSVFTGSGNAILLAPTTFTGEVITPAYKKFIAVTNVYKNDNESVSAQNGDAQCKQILKQLNAQSNLCEAIPGSHRTIPFSFAAAKGYTIEFIYQGLDYQGITSTDKYYAKIK